jgi:hypothetical protein
MNLNCMNCAGPFGELDTVVCDGCHRPSHREPCGEYEVIPADSSRTGFPEAYFFCNRCLDTEGEQ